MSQWQYHVKIYSFKELENPECLNSLGEKDWELVCLKRLSATQKGTQMQWLAVFKKQLVEKEK